MCSRAARARRWHPAPVCIPPCHACLGSAALPVPSRLDARSSPAYPNRWFSCSQPFVLPMQLKIDPQTDAEKVIVSETRRRSAALRSPVCWGSQRHVVACGPAAADVRRSQRGRPPSACRPRRPAGPRGLGRASCHMLCPHPRPRPSSLPRFSTPPLTVTQQILTGNPILGGIPPEDPQDVGRGGERGRGRGRGGERGRGGPGDK